jgi:hypothetical protein
VRAYHRDCGFWPGDVAADVIGGAIGTAGAIATAPFRNDAYAYNSGYYGQRYYGGYYNITTVLPVSPARHSEARTASATSVSNEAV